MLGVGLTVLLHALLIPLGLLAGLLVCVIDRASSAQAQPQWQLCLLIGMGAVLLFIGLSQLVYIVPAMVIARRRRRIDVFQGLAVGAVITFLLNATCWGLVRAGGVI